MSALGPAPGAEFQDAVRRARAVLAAAGQGDVTDEVVREIVHAVAGAFGILIGRVPSDLTADELRRLREMIKAGDAEQHPVIHVTSHCDADQAAALRSPGGRAAFDRGLLQSIRATDRERPMDAADFARAEDGSLVAPFPQAPRHAFDPSASDTWCGRCGKGPDHPEHGA